MQARAEGLQLMRMSLGGHAGGAVGEKELLAYYSRRAGEHEQIYEKPERRADLGQVRSWLREALAGHRILEVACGTGYWTAELAPVAAAITATDSSPATLEVARGKSYPPGRVCLALADAYALADVPGDFTAGLAAFWWSHVPRERQSAFLGGLHRRLGLGPWWCSSTTGTSQAAAPRSAGGMPARTHTNGADSDGTEYEVLKNFPAAAELEATLAPFPGS